MINFQRDLTWKSSLSKIDYLDALGRTETKYNVLVLF